VSKEAMKLALNALESGVDGQTSIEMDEAIAALREALEQPAQKCSYPYCGCNSKAWCKVERNEALDKMAENARELGLDYEPVQEPVAWMDRDGDLYANEPPKNWCPPHYPLYTTPPAAQRTWVGLTDEEYAKLAEEFGPFPINQIEAKLKEKNT
jgi:hypothetical protein